MNSGGANRPGLGRRVIETTLVAGALLLVSGSMALVAATLARIEHESTGRW